MTGHAQSVTDLIDAAVGPQTLAQVAARYCDAIAAEDKCHAAVEAARRALVAAVEAER